jgi:hypothetical protein
MASTRGERAPRGRSFAAVASSGAGGALRAAPVAPAEAVDYNGSFATTLCDQLVAGLQPSAAAERGRAELIAAVRATLAPAFPGVLVRARGRCCLPVAEALFLGSRCPPRRFRL